ncbi:MAG: molybdopterin-dependent oxidoreductase [bacterium]
MASINITIDGQKVTAQTGQTVLEAAKAAGIDIPTLCHHPSLKPIGACRVCLVEIAGQRTLQPACTFPVADKMDVKTESPKVIQARKFVMELIFTERNHFCMYCEMSGDCELQKLAYRYGIDHMTYDTYAQRFPVDATPTYHLLDHNRCILCRRCIRACAERVANHTLDMRQRGAASMIHADMNLPIGESSCLSCGNCLDVCPTGALIDKRSAFMARSEQSESCKTVCAQCSVGCGVDVVTRGGSILRIQGDPAGPVNGGLLCKKGRFEVLYDPRPRILTPLLEAQGKQAEADWEQALKTVVDRLGRTAGPKLGVLASSHATNEALFLVSKLFSKELKSAQIGLLNAAAPALSKKSEGSLADILASDCIVVAGADPAQEQPVASFFVKRAVDGGARLIVVEDRESALAVFAETVLGTKEVRKAVEAAQAARKPVVLYGAGLGSAERNELKSLEGKACFVALQPGVNTFAAVRFGLDKGADLSGLEVLYVLAGDQEVDAKTALKGIGKETFLIVQASHASALTERADVVLPMAGWAERSGTLTNATGVVQEARKATEPAGSSKPDWEILSLLAARLGKKLGASLDEIAVSATQQLQ